MPIFKMIVSFGYIEMSLIINRMTKTQKIRIRYCHFLDTNSQMRGLGSNNDIRVFFIDMTYFFHRCPVFLGKAILNDKKCIHLSRINETRNINRYIAENFCVAISGSETP
ncbi:hypothetical protein CAP48_10665 [Advenella sp. S44]|nr:hypothetical protein CAP48_10665 [Advenella sp. S44]